MHIASLLLCFNCIPSSMHVLPISYFDISLYFSNEKSICCNGYWPVFSPPSVVRVRVVSTWSPMTGPYVVPRIVCVWTRSGGRSRQFLHPLASFLGYSVPSEGCAFTLRRKATFFYVNTVLRHPLIKLAELSHLLKGINYETLF
jgi:hypothetical protein